MRAILTRYEWNERLISWLHSYFLDLLDKNILPVYLDILQTLHSKCPLLTQAMLGSTVHGETGVGLQLLLSRVWDPALGGIRSLDNSISQFESQPTFIIVPSCNFGGRARWYLWSHQLRRLGKIRQCCLTKKIFVNKPGIVKVTQVTRRIIKIVYKQVLLASHLSLQWYANTCLIRYVTKGRSTQIILSSLWGGGQGG